jgi:catechol 2,3-dioxygenase-like lactoylglutathione lyase family enzyme
MTSRLVALCMDANDPARLAPFWAEALGWRVDAGTEEVGLAPTDGTPFRIVFQPVRERKDAKTKNSIHLDLTTASVEDEAATFRRLLELGARHVDIGQGPEETHVLADPEGNELCVIEPDNAFLAGCGRLGSITCDGSPAAGYFWSEVLGWPLVWDQDEETAIRAADGTGPLITWGPPVPTKTGKNRLHLDISPHEVDQTTEVTRLIGLGATPADVGQGDDVDWVVLADPDGNEFCVLNPG